MDTKQAPDITPTEEHQPLEEGILKDPVQLEELIRNRRLLLLNSSGAYLAVIGLTVRARQLEITARNAQGSSSQSSRPIAKALAKLFVAERSREEWEEATEEMPATAIREFLGPKKERSLAGLIRAFKIALRVGEMDCTVTAIGHLPHRSPTSPIIDVPLEGAIEVQWISAPAGGGANEVITGYFTKEELATLLKERS